MSKSLLSKYQGADGGRRLIETLQAQSLVQERVLAAELARVVKPELIPAGQILIEQGSRGKDLFLILSGTFAIKVDGQVISQPGPKQYIGEIGLLDPKGRRSAAVVATTNSVVARAKAADFCALADKYPRLWRTIATDLALRLLKGAEPSVRPADTYGNTSKATSTSDISASPSVG